MPLFDLLLELPNHLVLASAFGFMALLLVGGIVRAEASGALGAMIRMVGSAGLTVAFGITLVQLGGAFIGVPLVAGVAMAAQASAPVLRGGETRVPLGEDGHYWVDASVNGTPQRFLIDTGATYTTLSSEVAQDAMVEPNAGAGRVNLHTANGDTPAKMAQIDSLEVGSIHAADMTTIIAPAIGTTNVLGMNFLSSLEGWRVEGKVMILTPKGSDQL